MAIETLAYHIIADTSNFTTGVVATKKELSFLKGVMQETKTPVENVTAKMDALNKLFGEGKIQPEAYGKAMAHLKTQLSDVSQKGLQPLKDQLGTLAPGIQGTIGRFSGLAAALGPIGIAVGAAVLGFESLKAVFVTLKDTVIGEVIGQFKEMAKLADELATLDFAPGDVIGIGLAGGRAGVSQDTIVQGFKEMQKNIGLTSMDMGKAKAMFNELGLSAQDMLRKSAKEQFLEIAEAINSLGTEAERAAAAQKIFGGSGDDMLRLISLGSAGLQDAISQAEKWGLTISELDLSQIDAADDAISDMVAAWQGLARVLAVEVAPVVTAIADGLIALREQVPNEGVGRGIGAAARAALGTVPFVGPLAESVGGAVFGGITGNASQLSEGRAALEMLNKQIAEQQSEQAAAEQFNAGFEVEQQWQEMLAEWKQEAVDAFGDTFDKFDLFWGQLNEEISELSADSIRAWREWTDFQIAADEEVSSAHMRALQEWTAFEFSFLPDKAAKRKQAAFSEGGSLQTQEWGGAEAFQTIERGSRWQDFAARQVDLLSAIEANTRDPIDVRPIDSLEPAL